jgi:transcriptional regulator with XRE-family HTH domain
MPPRKLRKFKDFVRAEMSPEDRARADAATSELLGQMPLQELRRSRDMSQETLAEAMRIPQSALSKIERRTTDAYVGTIRRYVEAMGAELRLIAAFDDGNLEIDQFTTDDSGCEGKMPLKDLRRSRDISQEMLAEEMHVPQSTISKIERRTTDAHIGTIRRYVEALGAKLHIVAQSTMVAWRLTNSPRHRSAK